MPALASRKAPVPKVAVGLPGLQAALADQRGWWLTDQAADGPYRRKRSSSRSGRRAGSRAAARSASPNRSRGRSPNGGVRVGRERAARGGNVGHELAGELVDEPAVGRGDHTVGSHVAPQPRQLRRGEVRVEHEPGPPAEGVLVFGQIRADLSARRSGQTIRFDSGRPVSGSQASTDSPWLAMVTISIGTPASATAARPALTTEARRSCGSCSTRPPGRWRRSMRRVRCPQHLPGGVDDRGRQRP